MASNAETVSIWWRHHVQRGPRRHSLAALPATIPALVILYSCPRSIAIQGMGKGFVAGQLGPNLKLSLVKRAGFILGFNLSTMYAGFLRIYPENWKHKNWKHQIMLKIEYCHMPTLLSLAHACCEDDKLLRCQWRQSWHHDNSRFLFERLIYLNRLKCDLKQSEIKDRWLNGH